MTIHHCSMYISPVDVDGIFSTWMVVSTGAISLGRPSLGNLPAAATQGQDRGGTISSK